jgi:hypothetical protein
MPTEAILSKPTPPLWLWRYLWKNKTFYESPANWLLTDGFQEVTI